MALALHDLTIRIPAGDAALEGVLRLPEECLGMVLFAQGRSSSRVRPPNDYIAGVLQRVRLGTVWLDLLTPEEARDRHAVDDAALLARRLAAACDWLSAHEATRELPLGLFGSGNAAGAALHVAALRGNRIAALVTRGARPELEKNGILGNISAPTLMIVGGLDDGAMPLNRNVYAALRCKKRFEIIPGATHWFEEPGNLEVVARMARTWFQQHVRFMLA